MQTPPQVACETILESLVRTKVGVESEVVGDTEAGDIHHDIPERISLNASFVAAVEVEVLVTAGEIKFLLCLHCCFGFGNENLLAELCPAAALL